jgi:succinoglycan biosynthesis protein ExoA
MRVRCCTSHSRSIRSQSFRPSKKIKHFLKPASQKGESVQPSQAVHVSVIVPCRNEIRHIRGFLDSVFQQELGHLEMEVLVADGMSDDGTRLVLEEFEKKFAVLRVINNPEQIASAGLNQAIREAKGEIILRMDAHSFYAPDYVRSCVEVLLETNADNVGGPLLTRADGYLAKAIALACRAPFARGGVKFRDSQYEGPVDTVTYGCWRKSTLVRIGLFDEEQVRSQDYELNVRIASRGGIVWRSPRIVSWYWPRTSLSGLLRQYFQYGFWKVAVIRKHRGLASWRNFVPGLCLLAGAAVLLCAAAARLGGSVRWQNAFLGVWLTFAGLYLLASLAAAFSVAKREGWRFLPCLPIVFAIYHLSYAFGFALALFYRPAAGERQSPMRKVLTALTR